MSSRSPRPPLPRPDLEEIVNASGNDWEHLRGERIFFTGGTGFVGSWLLESFLAACDRFDLDSTAVVLTRDPASFQARAPHVCGHSAITLLQGDITSFTHPSGEFRFVIHAATEASAKLNEEQPGVMFESIVSGTRRTLDFALGAGARRFLLTSSGAVYGRQPPSITHLTEEYAGGPVTTDPRSAYGEGKRAAELLCAIYAARGLEPLIARCFAFVGPLLPLDRHFAIGNFIGDALAGRPIEILGDGTPRRSYLYAADLASWLWAILFRGQAMRPYNVGSEVALSISDVAHAVAGAVDAPPEVAIAQKSTEGKEPERYVPDAGRVRAELGVTQQVDFNEAVRRTIAWHRLLTASL